MRALKSLLAITAALAFLAMTDPASAGGGHRGGGHRGGGHWGGPHVSVGVWGPGWWGGWGGYWGPRYWGPGYWGAGYWGPGYWGAGYPYTWPSTTVIVPQEPRIYVERDEVAAPPPASGQTPAQWWYWCASANTYYPYVSTCSEGWQRVPPQPARAPR